jgi:hypothetical protein
MTRPIKPQDRSKAPDAAFACDHCGGVVPGSAPGTAHRNHCPRCLWSMHVDIRTGDRRSGCRGPMEPIAVWTRTGGEWAVLHRCRRCGLIRSNRVSGDDNELLLLSIALRPLARPAFPLERLGEEWASAVPGSGAEGRSHD